MLLVLVLVDVNHIWHQSRLDPEILKLLQLHASTPSVLVLNKVPLSMLVSHSFGLAVYCYTIINNYILE